MTAERDPRPWPSNPTRPSEFSAWPATSTRPGELAAAFARRGPTQAAVFDDLCQSAFALRALLAVQGAVLVAALVGADTWSGGLARVGPVLVSGLIGTLLWLLLGCALRRRLAGASPASRNALLLALAALLAVLAAAPLAAASVIDLEGPRLLALPLAGAALAAPLLLWLDARSRQRRPADASARLAELQSRIRPHFLFNALNTALALVRVDPLRAEAVLEDLAELFRVALAEPGSAVSLGEEVALARRYLDIEQVRFGERLHIDWELDAACAGARVPPLLLQPLVENAVRHGIEPAAQGGVIRVRTRRVLGQVEIAIDNTLPRPDAAAGDTRGHGIALANVRERLRLMHDLAGQFDARRLDGWYRVRIVVPLGAAA